MEVPYKSMTNGNSEHLVQVLPASHLLPSTGNYVMNAMYNMRVPLLVQGVCLAVCGIRTSSLVLEALGLPLRD